MLPDKCNQTEPKERDVESVCGILKPKINEIKNNAKKYEILKKYVYFV